MTAHTAFYSLDLVLLSGKLKQIRDLDPPMSIICLNELIEQVDACVTTITADASKHSGYEIGSGREL